MVGIRQSVKITLSVVLVSLLAVGVVQPVSALGFTAESAVASEATPDPLLPDESVEPKTPAGETLQVGDFSNPPADSTPIAPVPAPAPALQESAPNVENFDKSTAKVLSEGEYERTYQGPGNTKMTEFSDVPLNVRIGGKWKPVLTDISGRGPAALLGKGGAEVAQHPLAPVFAERADESPLLSVTRDGRQVSFSLEDASNGSLQRDQSPCGEQGQGCLSGGVPEHRPDLRSAAVGCDGAFQAVQETR